MCFLIVFFHQQWEAVEREGCKRLWLHREYFIIGSAGCWFQGFVSNKIFFKSLQLQMLAACD